MTAIPTGYYPQNPGFPAGQPVGLPMAQASQAGSTPDFVLTAQQQVAQGQDPYYNVCKVVGQVFPTQKSQTGLVFSNNQWGPMLIINLKLKKAKTGRTAGFKVKEIKVVAYGQLAQGLANALQAGMNIGVIGELEPRNYQDKQTGQWQRGFQINVGDGRQNPNPIYLVGPRPLVNDLPPQQQQAGYGPQPALGGYPQQGGYPQGGYPQQGMPQQPGFAQPPIMPQGGPVGQPVYGPGQPPWQGNWPPQPGQMPQQPPAAAPQAGYPVPQGQPGFAGPQFAPPAPAGQTPGFAPYAGPPATGQQMPPAQPGFVPGGMPGQPQGGAQPPPNIPF